MGGETEGTHTRVESETQRNRESDTQACREEKAPADGLPNNFQVCSSGSLAFKFWKVKTVWVYTGLTQRAQEFLLRGRVGSSPWSVLFPTQTFFLVPPNQALGQKFSAPAQNIFPFLTGLSADRNLLVHIWGEGEEQERSSQKGGRREEKGTENSLPSVSGEEPTTPGVAQCE